VKILELKITPRDDPFPHLFFSRVFTDEAYEMLLSTLPTGETLPGTRRVYSIDGRFKEALLDPVLKDSFSKLLETEYISFPKVILTKDTPGFFITPQVGSIFRIMTVIIFLPEDTSQKMLGNRLFKMEDHKPTFMKQFGFFPNTGFAFKNTEESWHDLPTIDSLRHTLQIYYLDTPNGMLE